MQEAYSTSFTVDQSPEDVFAAITNIRGWWGEQVEGSSDQLGAEFTYSYRDIHRCHMKTSELVPNKKLVWHVLDNYFNFTEDKTEWKGTDLIFEVAKKGDKTELRFTHQGLVPEYECYELCSNSWGFYINGSLKNLITSGTGQPNGQSSNNIVDRV